MNTPAHSEQNRPIVIWLLLVCTLIFAMVILGGVTRLTNSGLSMVEWKPVVGWLPPLSDSAWQETFSKYQQSPEYLKINKGMSVDEFKGIFYFEYAHRVLGRIIGLAFLLPFLYFLIRKKLQRSMTPKLVIMFVLGGLQGVLGWYMVKSGLVNNPHVSQYRLTAHLSAAMAIYCYILWVAMGMIWNNSANIMVDGFMKIRRFGLIVTSMIVLMILSGGFVAGTRAGLAFNTFPLMGNSFVPPDLFSMSPFYLNFFENIATIQFDHRLIAYALTLMIPIFWWRIVRSDLQQRTKTIANLFLLMLVIQLGLGISTLLMHVPVALAATHQGGALVLLTLAVLLNSELKKPA